jgi:hypothetical protein
MVPVHVVHLLEPVEVDREHARSWTAAATERERVLETVEEDEANERGETTRAVPPSDANRAATAPRFATARRDVHAMPAMTPR